MVTDGARADHYDVAASHTPSPITISRPDFGHGHLALGPELGEVVVFGEQ